MNCLRERYPDQAWQEVLGGASPSPEDAPQDVPLA